ncbi:TPA: hypothetical protein HA241_06090 [Candidatus Woesearchaeota archaeon]|nr:hypothetical protein [Candidatus Woesearchaeota archaeon]
MKNAIKHNGTTIQNYSHLTGKGEFQNFLAVYQRKRCPKKHSIERLTQSSRSTYYCSRCQR